MGIKSEKPFRFIYSGYHNGFINMAMDEAVMIGLEKERSSPVLRVYKWHPPTISIGYFQPISEINLIKCKEDGIGVVRRLTGGRAVLHHMELTYSIIFSEREFEPFTKKEIFSFIANCLIETLRIIGIEARIAEKSRGSLTSADCFASPAQYEIESKNGEKLIGSAQVIRRGIVLQHGAIPLSDSYKNIYLYLENHDKPASKLSKSLSDSAGRIVTEEELLRAIFDGFSRFINLKNGEFTPDENILIRKLAEEKYSSEEWLKRR